MKVAVLSESPADEAAIRILVEAVLGQPTEPPPRPTLRSRGWPSVRDILPSIIKHLHYQTDADGLIVVVDANGSPLHDDPDADPTDVKGRSRLSLLSAATGRTQADLKPVPQRSPLRVAIGLAAPAIEAWYRCGLDATASEVAWTRELKAGTQPRGKIKSLKRDVYGTDVPPLSVETQVAIEQARRLAANLALLQKRFSIGFGSLADEVRSWGGTTG